MRQRIEARLSLTLPAIDPRERFLANIVGPVSSELQRVIDQPSQQAAVLIPLIERRDGLTLLFTERAHHLTHHAGQVSFPGGRLEGPSENFVDAALREAEEEVGLARGDVSVVGQLGPHVTGTGFNVTPVVGFVPDGFEARPDPAEVQDAFEVPLAHFLPLSNVRKHYWQRFGSCVLTYEFDYDGHRIWGATAAMLMTFLKAIND